MMAPILYLVVPCYNEEAALLYTVDILKEKLFELMDSDKVSKLSRIMFINDGSKDSTWEIIEKASQGVNGFVVGGVNLIKNVGHQNALLAGLTESVKHADIMISIDADLQQDISAIDEMIDRYNAGNDVVYGVRNDRGTDGVMKKITALSFYKIMKMMGCNIITNHADYRLMSKRAVSCLAEYEETNMFLRGMVPELGLPSSEVYFNVKEREYGESKYTLKKMIKLASDGITSFSTSPLHFIFLLGIFTLLVSVIMIITTVVAYFKGNVVSGWSTLMCSMYFLGGEMLMALGVVGEYCGKMYLETKHRPRYHVDKVLLDEGNEVVDR